MTTRKQIFSILFGCMLFVLGASNSLFSATIYVNTNATGSNTGVNWANAFTDLQSALAASGSGDQIWVAAGVYKPTSSNDRSIPFQVTSGVSLYGGFNGTETALNQRDWSANATVLSGAIGSQVDVTDNTRTLIRVNNASQPVVISGFKIRRAYHEGGSNIDVINSANVTFSKCEFNIHFSAAYLLYANSSNVLLEDCLFHSNDGNTLLGSFIGASINGYSSTFSKNSFSFLNNSSANSEIKLFNCIVWEPDVPGTNPVSGATNCIISDPTWFPNGDNLLLTDPLFVNPASNNFRLQPGSPAINFGNPDFTDQGFDLDRNLRIYGVAPDAGCYEARIPTRLYVDVDATGLNNGANWTNAFNDLQDALAASIPGDEIWVAEGTYYPTSGTSRSSNFNLPDGILLYGGFNGSETNRNQRNWQNNLTILSGDIGAQGDLSDNCYHVVRMSSMGDDYFIDGFVIESGNANSGSLNGEGGGITIQGASSAVVQNCWIRNNSGNFGGGIHMRTVPNNVVVQQSIFQNNESAFGGAIYLANNPDIRSCLFLQNYAQDAGIVFAEEDASFKLNNCTFYLNDLQTAGSHVIDGQGSGASWIITNSIFWLNNHPNQVAPIYDQGQNALVSHCILQNAAYSGNQNEIYVGAPLFINPLMGNFALQNNSPGMNAGDNSQVQETLDAFGNERIRFGTVDIGAVEGVFTPSGVVFVDLDATGNNDGSSWANAFTDLGDALDTAVEGEAIWVAEGSYLSPGLTGSFPIWQLPDGVDLIGGFSGDEWQASQAAPWDHETIISGNAGNPNDPSDNVSGLLGCYDTNNGVNISGFTFEGVYRIDNFGRGAIVVYNITNPTPDLVSVVVKDCIFRDNFTFQGASCVSISVQSASLGNQASIEMENCLFYDNSGEDNLIASTIGNSCFITLNNCTFTENSVTAPNNLRRIVSGQTGTVININNTIFWNNIAPNEFSSIASVSNSIFEHNSPTGVNNLQVDPLFADPANNNFTLSESSPAVGAGDNGFVNFTFDLVGNIRIQEGTVDMGCYESPFIGSPSGGCPGDFDGDGLISASDLLVVLGTFGANCGSPFCGGDMTGDGIVDTSDLLSFIALFGTSCP